MLFEIVDAVKSKVTWGNSAMHRAIDAQASGRVRSENRVAECDVIAPATTAADILQDDSAGTMKKRPSYTGTMGQCSKRCRHPRWLDVANHVLRAGAFKMRVPLQRRQSIPAWNGKWEALQVGR